MYNFLDARLTPNVSTQCPSTDGHEACNLISEIAQIKSKGFLAFSAIRPPVEVDFELICPIRIHYIAIWNTINSQKSSGFEIYAKSGENDYKMIGKTFSEGSGIAMCNRKIYNSKRPPVPHDFSVCFFKAIEFKIFTCTDKLKIKIIRTLNSVPCIGRIEIWGNVASSCTEKTKETIHYLMTPKIRLLPQIQPNINEPSTSKTKINDFEVPTEFLDDISCEIISIPMTLPCGKTVDQSTLEKHAKSDSVWGRIPSDPYTGIPFTSTHKPILNTALKNRIDEFLFKNKDRIETKYIQRTVGRKRPDVLPEYANIQGNKKFKFNNSTKCLKSTSSDDLDSAIEETLTKYNITRFSIDQKRVVERTDLCIFCKSDINLYELKVCKHLICRQCLINMEAESSCKNCNKPVNKCDVQKYHGL